MVASVRCPTAIRVLPEFMPREGLHGTETGGQTMQQSGRILTLAITAFFALALAGCAMDDAMMSEEMDAAPKYVGERGGGSERGEMMGDGDMGDGDMGDGDMGDGDMGDGDMGDGDMGDGDMGDGDMGDGDMGDGDMGDGDMGDGDMGDGDMGDGDMGDGDMGDGDMGDGDMGDG